MKNGYRIARCADIVRCEAAGNYTTVFSVNGDFFALQAAEGGGGTTARYGFLQGTPVAFGEFGVGGAMGAGGVIACWWGDGACGKEQKRRAESGDL